MTLENNFLLGVRFGHLTEHFGPVVAAILDEVAFPTDAGRGAVGGGISSTAGGTLPADVGGAVGVSVLSLVGGR